MPDLFSQDFLISQLDPNPGVFFVFLSCRGHVCGVSFRCLKIPSWPVFCDKQRWGSGSDGVGPLQECNTVITG